MAELSYFNMSVSTVRTIIIAAALVMCLAVVSVSGQPDDFEVLDFNSDTIAMSCPVDGAVHLRITARRINSSVSELEVRGPSHPSFTSGVPIPLVHSFDPDGRVNISLTFMPRSAGTVRDSIRLTTPRTSRTLYLIGRGFGAQMPPTTLYFQESAIHVVRQTLDHDADTTAHLVNGSQNTIIIDSLFITPQTSSRTIATIGTKMVEGGDTTRVNIFVDRTDLALLKMMSLVCVAHVENDSSLALAVCSLLSPTWDGANGKVSIMPDPISTTVISSEGDLRTAGMMVFNGTSDTIQLSDVFAFTSSVEVGAQPGSPFPQTLAPNDISSFIVRCNAPRCESISDEVTAIYNAVNLTTELRSVSAAFLSPGANQPAPQVHLLIPSGIIGSVVPVSVVVHDTAMVPMDSIFISISYDASAAVPATTNGIVADTILGRERYTTYTAVAGSSVVDTIPLGSIILTLGRSAELAVRTTSVRIISPLPNTLPCEPIAMDTVLVDVGGVRGREVDPMEGAPVVRLFPNPAAASGEMITIEYHGSEPLTEVCLQDQLGASLACETLHDEGRSSTFIVKLPRISAGCYHVRLCTQTESFTRQLIVQ